MPAFPPRRGTRRRLLGHGAAAALGLALPPLAGATPGDLDDLLKKPVRVDPSENPAQGVFFSLFRESPLTEVVEDAQHDYRIKPACVMWFTRFGTAFPESQVRFLAQQGIAAHVTWEPWGLHDEAIPLADVAAGKWDAYLDAYGAAAARLDLPFILRWGHEFNGDWYPWCLVHNGQGPALYVKAYRRVVERLRAAGAGKIQWVWCFNHESKPGFAWNTAKGAYPGDDVVDWVGIDGYNFGTSQSWSRWTSFRDVFRGALAVADEVAPRKPVMLAEMGCSETGGDKAAWIRQMFADLAALPRVRAFTWFDMTKETTWALTSSEAAWAATVQGLQAAHVRGNGPAMLAVARPAHPA